MQLKLSKGEVFAFKTDTVWGFGAHPGDKKAIENIYKIKHRDLKKPLILMSNSIEPLKKYVKYIPRYAQELIQKYLPGGLTLIFEKSDLTSGLITSNMPTVGIRVPKSEDFCALAEKIEGGVLATTSCNVSGEHPVLNYKEAFEKFSSYATIIKPINDTINDNLPSTVILCLEDNYKILRQGAVELK